MAFKILFVNVFLKMERLLVKSAIFLDRDGVINEVLSERVKFVNRPEDFYLLPGAGEAIHLLNQSQYPVFVVTNQGGVGLGYMKEQALLAIHEHMRSELAAYNAEITDISYCPHRPNAGCHCRKPNAGMLESLAKEYDISLSKSYMVGDRLPDIEAGKKAGTKTVLIGEKEDVKADEYFVDLLAFAKWITNC